jgi:CRP/FNR family cyclic AMP-dependent transcriptional regulator
MGESKVVIEQKSSHQHRGIFPQAAHPICRGGKNPENQNPLGIGPDTASQVDQNKPPPDTLPLIATMSSESSIESELPAVGFLADVSPEYRAFLACFGRFLRPASGEILIHEGDAQESLYMILAGKLHIITTADGRQMLLASLGEGDSFGEVNLFDPGKASATAVFRSNGLVWALSREELRAFIEADPAAGVSVLQGLLHQASSRIRHMNEKLTDAERRASFHDVWTIPPQ